MTIPLPVIANTLRASFIWGGGGVSPTPVNVMHFRARSGTPTPADLFSALNTNVTGPMWWPTQSSMYINQVNIIALDGVGATQTFTTDGSVKWTGAQAGEGTAQVCSIVKFSTGLRGRANRGRIYLPYAAESVVSGGRLSGAGLAAGITAWGTFWNNLSARTPIAYDLGVASYDRKHSGASAHFTQLTSITIEALTATQRRRQPGRKVSRH